ncbi:MAG: hypothetical protein Tsb0020_48630 [Haliangiales bacterium]
MAAPACAEHARFPWGLQNPEHALRCRPRWQARSLSQRLARTGGPQLAGPAARSRHAQRGARSQQSFSKKSAVPWDRVRAFADPRVEPGTGCQLPVFRGLAAYRRQMRASAKEKNVCQDWYPRSF